MTLRSCNKCFQRYRAITMAYISTRPIKCSLPASCHRFSKSLGTWLPKTLHGRSSMIRTPPIIALSPSALGSNEPSVNSKTGVGSPFNLTHLGAFCSNLHLSIAKGSRVPSSNVTLDFDGKPISLTSAMANRPVLPAS